MKNLLFKNAYSNKAPVLPKIKEWLERVKQGGMHRLLLLGPTGAGKTWLAWRILKFFDLDHPYVQFWPAQELADNLNSLFEYKYPDWRRLRILVLDDFTKAVWTDVGVARFNMLMDEFLVNTYYKSRALIVTSDKKDWAPLQLDPAMVRRVREGALEIIIRR